MKVLIVDDEPIARDGVRALLERDADIHIVGECGDGPAALARLERGGVDVCLLDIQMPGMDGFEVLEALPEQQRPVTVFLTAYDEHALRAFEAHALDYVVKPFTDERFRKAMTRARERVRQRNAGAVHGDLAAMLAALRSASDEKRLARIPVRSVGKTSYVRVDDITWIAAADYYAELHTRDGRKHLVRESLQSLEQRLDRRFVRTHRSAIVNARFVVEVRLAGGSGTGTHDAVTLRDGTSVPLVRSKREALEVAIAG